MDLSGFLTRLPYMIAAFLPALTFHEWAHAFVATKFGDDTAKRQGRLTLNPLSHLDPLGTVMIFLAGFGWAQPVPVDNRNFKSSWAEFWVASAGPLMNFALAIFFAILFRSGITDQFDVDKNTVITQILYLSIQLNLALAIFNLIPIGPLDGHYILARLLPLRASLQFNQWNAQWGGIILMGVVVAEMFLHIPILRLFVGYPVAILQHLLLS